MGETNRPWDRMKGEGDRPYAAFNAYRLQGPSRSFKMTSEHIGVTLSTIKNHAHKYEWTRRVKAWEDYVSQRCNDVVIDEAEKRARDRIEAIDRMRKRGLELIDNPNATSATGARLLSDSLRLERLELGEATERLEHKEKPFDWSLYSDDEVRVLRELLARQNEPK